MKNFLMFPLALTMTVAAQAQVEFRPPATSPKPVKDTLHNVVITDPFRWLEDKEDPEVVAWTKAQHDYGIEYLKQTQQEHPGLREAIASVDRKSVV